MTKRLKLNETESERPKLPDDKVLYEGVELLPVPLTRDELLDRGQQLAQVDAELRAHNEYAESVKKDLKSKESSYASETARLANIVRSKKEPRQVKTQSIARWEQNVVEVIRVDTGEVLRNRALEPNERQDILDLNTPPPTEPGATQDEVPL